MTTETLDKAQTTEQNGSCECACSATVFRPHTDVVETADGVVLTLDVPGASPEDVDVSVERGVLSVVARATERAPGTNARSVLREYGVGDFRREFRLGETLDGTRIDASLDRGVLTVRIPRAEAARPRKISVRAG